MRRALIPLLLLFSVCAQSQEIDLKLTEVDRRTEMSTGFTYAGLGVGLLGGGLVLAGQLNEDPNIKERMTIIGSAVAGSGVLLSFSAVVPIELLRNKFRKARRPAAK